MIVTVTLDAALDTAYRIGGPLLPGDRHQATGPVERATGTGLNVSRLLARLGHRTTATGFVGGEGGERIRARLAAEGGIVDAMVEISDSSRRTVSLVHALDALEPGPWPLNGGRHGGYAGPLSGPGGWSPGPRPSGEWQTGSWQFADPAAGSGQGIGRTALTVVDQYRPWITEPEWRALLGTFEKLLTGALAVALSTDSISGWGCDPLVRAGLRRGVPVLLDVTTDVSRTLLTAPDIVLLDPDLALAGQEGGGYLPAIGPGGHPPRPVSREVAIGQYATRLQQEGARTVVVPLGAGDLLGFTPEGIWRATGPVHPSATVSREAVAAGLLSGLVEGISWPERIRRAVALSAVAMPPPAAGEFEPGAYQAYLPEVQLTRMAPVPGIGPR